MHDAILDFQLFWNLSHFCLTKWVLWILKHGCRRQNYIKLWGKNQTNKQKQKTNKQTKQNKTNKQNKTKQNKTKKQKNNKQIIATLSNLTPISTALLELQLIRLSNKTCFGQIGFLDPQNMDVDTKITTLR